ncbi:A/G-specific adenine glycosylase [Methanococcus maripaludis]|uniref:A/G-specific adenine glycosylase n=1 Tax=Methanococcus maripaludis TaxID=39152 RepID=A0A7J9P1W2_METMI|nr:A/G-specific adenine glycosylase [Methanococcus maripaludis]MBA2853475.1 A/G-specific adenine glycosylase [Methanococcus maripaludis]
MAYELYFVKNILNWYSENRRIFPWRYTFDPFKVFISEIMLQRTRAENVIEPYKKMLNNFKSVADIEKVNQNELTRILNTLGLKYRVKRLKNISESFCENYSCNIPNNQNDLLNTSGIGQYICNAILCFGYGMKYPIFDTNVLRIFERFFGVKSMTKSPHKDKKMWDFAEKLLPEENYVDYNYSLLDFAAKVCKARNPCCKECPLNYYCKYPDKYVNSTKT